MIIKNKSESDKLRELYSTSDPNIKKTILLEISESNIRYSVDFLTPFLGDDDHDVRSAAVSALSVQKPAKVVPLLIGIARESTNERIRAYALHLLGDHKSPEILSCLLSEVDRPKKSRIPRQTVASQLAKYDVPESIAALKILSEDEDYIVQDNATKSLLKLNRREFRSLWEKILLSSKDPVVLNRARKALAQLENRK